MIELGLHGDHASREDVHCAAQVFETELRRATRVSSSMDFGSSDAYRGSVGS
jgi:hypothetical protein